MSDDAPESIAPSRRGRRTVLARTATELLAAVTPITRYEGQIAEVATRRAEASRGDRDARVALARRYAERGTSLDEACKLALAALEDGEIPGLRGELAAWLEALGEPGRAAEVFEGAAVGAGDRMRLARLLARAGEGDAAASAVRRALVEDADDPDAASLLGALGTAFPDAVSEAARADAFLEAAKRRAARGDREGALRERFAAFEASPAHEAAAVATVSALRRRGREEAADDAWQRHLVARGDASALVALAAAALDRGDVAGALGVILDAGLDRGTNSEVRLVTTRALSEAGLLELLAARFDVEIDHAEPAARVSIALALADLLHGKLGSADRAVSAAFDAIDGDPTNVAAFDLLVSLANAARDAGAVAEALLWRSGKLVPEAARVVALRALREHAEILVDATLEAYAVGELEALGAFPEVAAARVRLEPRLAHLDAALVSATSDAEAATTDRELVAALRRKVTLLRGRPGDLDAYVDALATLFARVPAEREVRLAFERAAHRAGRGDAFVTAARGVVASGVLERADELSLRARLLSAGRRADDREVALAEARALLTLGKDHRPSVAAVVATATVLGDPVLRAEALVRLATSAGPALRARLLAHAASEHLAAGDAATARAVAAQALHADSTATAAISALARASVNVRDKDAAEALERAAGSIAPPALLLEALAAAREAGGEVTTAYAWTQRWLALRPGDVRVLRPLLARALATGNDLRVADALGTVLLVPAPTATLAAPVAEVIRAATRAGRPVAPALLRRIATELGAAIAASDDLGVAIAEAAAASHAPALAAELRERAALAAPSPASLLASVDAWLTAGDDLAALDGLLRAARSGTAGADIRQRLAAVAESDVADVKLLRAAIRAELAARSASPEAPAALRDFGALAWDAAGDHAVAIAAWLRAAELSPDEAAATFAHDLVTFAGPARLVDEVPVASLAPEQRQLGAKVLALVAARCVELDAAEPSFLAAAKAIELDASRVDALGVAEEAVAKLGSPGLLEPLYATVAENAKGAFGRRAARYRAARTYDRLGERELALKHAAAAFECVPGMGTTYALLVRLAKEYKRGAAAIESIERVAEAERDGSERALWLLRAADLADDDEDGQRQRIDILLRALRLRPEALTVSQLGRAMADLVTRFGEDPRVAQVRFERAISVVLANGAGPYAARLAIAFARTAIETLDAPTVALTALFRALVLDADLEDYEPLIAHANLLARAEGSVPNASFVAKVRAMGLGPRSPLGRGALRLASSISLALGDVAGAAELLRAAADRDPDDEELVHAAEALELRANHGEDEEAAPAPRWEALLRLAADREAEGDLEGAVDALRQAREAADATPVDRAAARARLRGLLRRLGRDTDALAQLEAELAEDGHTGDHRAALRRESAAILAAHGELDAALRELERGAEDAPQNAAVLTDLASIARRAAQPVVLVKALRALLPTTTDEAARRALRHELARGLEATQDTPAAMDELKALLAEDPRDHDAWVALERLALAAADYELLATALAQRIALATAPDETRVLRLRRAALLEQRLGRLDETRAELEALLAAQPHDASAMRFLADILERLGDGAEAAKLWLRAIDGAGDPRDAIELVARGAAAYLSVGLLNEARAALDTISTDRHTPRLFALRVDIERKSDDPKRLADALDALAVGSRDDAETRATLLVEAARASFRGGDMDGALERAYRAARLAPGLVEAQLVAHWLAYRLRGVGDAAQAARTVDELRALTAQLAPEQIALHGFLLAESLDAAYGGASGMRELSARHAEIGPAPLIALGMGERMMRSGNLHAALPLFDAALAGDVLGVRSRGAIALAAADAATRVDDFDRAAHYLEVASADPATANAAAARLAEFAGVRERRTEPPPDDRQRLVAEVARAVGIDRARALRDLARVIATHPAEISEADRLLAEAIGIAAHDAQLKAELEVERAALRVPQAIVRRSTVPPAPIAPPAALDSVGQARARFLAAPGNAAAFTLLREAAERDRDGALVHALAQMHACFTSGAAPVVAPSLLAQREEPDLVNALLARGVATEVGEALALAWDGASHLFRREAGTYGITGLDRVAYNGAYSASRVYASAARLLGAGRIPLFQRRSNGPVSALVALLVPPSVVLAGDARDDTPELRYRLGHALAAAAPERALLFALPEVKSRSLLSALLVGFGPPVSAQTMPPAVSALATSLWQALSPRAQRRLRDIVRADDLVLERALADARRITHRTALFLAGDIGVAVTEVIDEERLAVAGGARDFAWLEATCRAHPSIADLVQFASSPEYADARFQPDTRSARLGSGAFRLGG